MNFRAQAAAFAIVTKGVCCSAVVITKPGQRRENSSYLKVF